MDHSYNKVYRCVLQVFVLLYKTDYYINISNVLAWWLCFRWYMEHTNTLVGLTPCSCNIPHLDLFLILWMKWLMIIKASCMKQCTTLKWKSNQCKMQIITLHKTFLLANFSSCVSLGKKLYIHYVVIYKSTNYLLHS